MLVSIGFYGWVDKLREMMSTNTGLESFDIQKQNIIKNSLGTNCQNLHLSQAKNIEGPICGGHFRAAPTKSGHYFYMFPKFIWHLQLNLRLLVVLDTKHEVHRIMKMFVCSRLVIRL